MTQPSSSSLWRRRLSLLARIAVVAALGLALVTGLELGELAQALGKVPLWAIGCCLAMGGLNMLIAALRWRALMRSFGAKAVPQLVPLMRAFLVGLYFNTFVPGSVGGDLARGVASMRCFEQVATSYVVVALERLIGLSALGCVFLVGLLVGPALVDYRAVAPYLAGLIGLGLVVLIGAFVARRLAQGTSEGLMARLGARLTRLVRQIPRVESLGGLLFAFGISLVGHGVNLTIFWLLGMGIGQDVGLPALAVIVPLGLLAGVIPIAVAGLGPREAALVGLFGLLGVAKAEALVISMGYAAVLLVLAGLGGVLALLGPGLSLAQVSPSAGDTNRSSGGAPPPG